MKRFVRTEMLLGREGLRALQHAAVAVAGLGAVGSYAVEGLARAGVGHLRVVDFDVVRETNINRQLYALESTRNLRKVDLAQARILDINPRCAVEAMPVFIDPRTVDAVLARPLDLMVDAIDSVGPKVELISACVRHGVPVISSMGAAMRTDPGAIRISDISRTDICPLARLVRKLLRKRGIREGVTCIYSIEPPVRKDLRGHVEGPHEEEILARGRPRRPLGSLSCLTGIFGLIAAREAIFRIARPGPEGGG
jgi:tRNA threonylcarbamoyladenosine dehydratase